VKAAKEHLLSDEQSRAVESDAEAIAVVAGAGTGKTEVVARRIERLLRESQSESFRVVAVTYTVKAADELRERLESRLGDLHRRVETDTVHGFALSLLRLYGTRIGLPVEPEVITRDEDRAELLVEWLQEQGLEPPEDPHAALTEIDLARSKCRDAPFLHEWRDALAAIGGVDYPAMLERALELTESSWVIRQLRRSYKHLIVDEAQNLTRSQYALLTAIIGRPSEERIRSVFVGDEKQSIVGFAGADHTLIAQFVQVYSAERIPLHRNYRSAELIVRLGEAVARELQFGSARDNTIYAARGSMEIQTLSSEEDEGSYVADWVQNLLNSGLPSNVLASGESNSVHDEEIAVLARSAAALRFTRAALEDVGIKTASASTEDEWVRSLPARVAVELVAYQNAPEHMSTRRHLSRLLGLEKIGDSSMVLSVLLNSHFDSDLHQLRKLCEDITPEEFISALQNLEFEDPDWDDDLAQIKSAWQTFEERTVRADRTFGNFRQHISRTQRGDNLESGVRLLTVHKAQGREFKAVVILAVNDGQIPDFRARDKEDELAERRIFYVATTRASRLLLLTRAGFRATRYGPKATQPSRYLGYVEQVLAKGQRALES